MSRDAKDIAAALSGLGFQVISGTDLDKRGLEQKVQRGALPVSAVGIGSSGQLAAVGIPELCKQFQQAHENHGTASQGVAATLSITARLASVVDFSFWLVLRCHRQFLRVAMIVIVIPRQRGCRT